MASEKPENTIDAAFPPPPSYYTQFTKENLERLATHIQSSSIGNPQEAFDPLDPVAGSIPVVEDLPNDLLPLIPPQPPRDGIYTTFGVEHNPTNSRLDSKYPKPVPSQAHLNHLLQQILLKFLHITHILSIDPSNKIYGPAWEELEAFFKEMHEGINAWRPHQARETVVSMMEQQISEVKSETKRVQETVAKAKDVYSQLTKASISLDTPKRTPLRKKTTSKHDRHTNQTRAIWEVIDTEVGTV